MRVEEAIGSNSESAAGVTSESASARRADLAREWLTRFPRAIPAILFLSVILVTAIGIYSIENSEAERARAEAREYSQSIASALDRRGNGFSSYLRAGAALFSSVENVSPQTFRQFVAELRIDRSYRGTEGIGWIETVDGGEIEAFRTRIAAKRPDFPSIRPAGADSRERVAPITYFSPDTTRNRRALGFDVYSEPVRASALDEARRTVQPTASGRLVLAQEGAGEAPGFAIFMPVYRNVPDTEAQERELAGYVFSSFNAGQFLDAAIESADASGFGVRLYDGQAASGNLLAARSPGSDGKDKFEQPVTIANREFLLVVESARSQVLTPLSMVSLIAGVALASLLSLIFRLLAKQAKEDQERLAFFAEQHAIRDSLSRELNHRVNNTLANVLSILSLTRRRAKNLPDFADSLEGRIRALSATHDLLTQSDWATIPVRDVIEAELQHISGSSTKAVTIEGPHVELAPKDALSLGLAIHELATNAAKFGALSTTDGSVQVVWELVSDTLAEMIWQESGGPPVSDDRKRGFGTDLIEKIVAHELKHKVELDFAREGVRCVLVAPVRPSHEFQIRERSGAPASDG